MSVFEMLSPQELAQQLRDPSGASGLEVADALGALNQAGNADIVADLALAPDDQVLEVGCGLASMAPAILGAAAGVRYTGLDQSATMIDAAADRHAALVRAGSARFHLGQIEQMPFAAACFTKVFSVGVIHFWRDPARALAELRRVMRPGALMVMGGLGPGRAPAFAQQAFGFCLHDTGQWRTFCLAAGLDEIDVRSVGPAGAPEVIRLAARA